MAKPTIITNLGFKKTGQIKQLRHLLKYLQHRDGSLRREAYLETGQYPEGVSDVAQQMHREAKWVDRGMGETYRQILNRAIDWQGRRTLARTWVISPDPVRDALGSLAGHPRVADCWLPRLGAKTGANEVFVDPPAEVEADCVRLALRGREVRPFRVAPKYRLLWPHDEAGNLAMATEPLDINGVLAELNGGPVEWTGLSPDTIIGHIHLHVADIPQAEKFYVDVLGFDLMVRYGPTASFISRDGYHHHIGVNTWVGRGAPRTSTAPSRQ